MGQLGPDATGLVPRGPDISVDAKKVTLSWEPRVQNAISRLPGGSGKSINTLIGGGLDRDAQIDDLRYDLEIYQLDPGAAKHQRAKDDYGLLWKAFWLPLHSYGDGLFDIQRERAYTLIHLRQGIKGTEYLIPFSLQAGTVYAWRVRPVYRYEGKMVAEDWMRTNISVQFGFISYANTVEEFITTAPPEFSLSPAKEGP